MTAIKLSLGKEHPHYIDTLAPLAIVYARTGREQEALILFRQCALHFRNYQARIFTAAFKINPSENLETGYIFIEHANTIMAALQKEPRSHTAYMKEAFTVLQSRFNKLAKSGAAVQV